MSMEQIKRKATGYELGSQKIQDIRVYLESVSRTLKEKQIAIDENQELVKTTTEVGIGEPMTTWPTFEAWIDSFMPSEKDIERDEELLARKHKKEVEESKGKGPGKVLTSVDPEPESNMKTARLCVVGLGKEPGKPTRRIITAFANDEVVDVLEKLHKGKSACLLFSRFLLAIRLIRASFNWITGFAVGEDDDKVPLIGPVVNQSARSIVATTDGVSSYNGSIGYAVNMDETLISFFNRSLMSRRSERNELTTKHTFD